MWWDGAARAGNADQLWTEAGGEGSGAFAPRGPTGLLGPKQGCCGGRLGSRNSEEGGQGWGGGGQWMLLALRAEARAQLEIRVKLVRVRGLLLGVMSVHSGPDTCQEVTQPARTHSWVGGD